MSEKQVNRPLSMNMDKSPKFLTETEAFYLLNHERYVNIHGKGNLGKTTPSPANIPLCEIDQPAGENYCVGTYRSQLTNEVYSWHYNSNQIHYILRTSNKGCEIVYHGPCLKLSAEPQHRIKQFRAYLRVEKTCKNWGGKQLIWTWGDEEIFCLDVEASILTSSFTTPFFEKGCYGECEYLLLRVPKMCGCMGVDYVKRTELDKGKSNHIVDVPFMFAYRHIYYNNLQVSEWSDMTQPFYQDSRGCFETADAFPRCMKLRIPIGSPMVDRIEVAYSTDGGVNFKTIEIIEKYRSYTSNTQQWYERELAPIITSTYDDVDCSFDYLFCNDKQCDPVDPMVMSRTYPQMPRQAQAIVPIKDAIGYVNYVDGTCPISSEEAKKLKFELDCKNTAECVTEYVTVKVRAVIHNYTKDLNQFVYRMGKGQTDDKTDMAMFGGLNHEGAGQGPTGGGFKNAYDYDQYFNGDRRNFISYIEGTEIYAEMKQYTANDWFKNYGKERGIVSDMGTKETRQKMQNFMNGGSFFYQEASFKVKRGMKGFIRMQNHHETEFNPETSTFVGGTMNIYEYRGHGWIADKVDWMQKEIYFTTCGLSPDKDTLELSTCFVIRDSAVDAGFEKQSTAWHGYIKDKNGKPLEGLRIDHPVLPSADEPYYGMTDHNGFYHGYAQPGFEGDKTFQIRGELGCVNGVPDYQRLKLFTLSTSSGTNVQSDHVIDGDDYDKYKEFKAKVRVHVTDCDNNPLGGVRVALSGSKWEVSGVDGYVEIEIRNRWGGGRPLRAILMDYKGCFGVDCDDKCELCLPELNGTAPSCFASGGTGIKTIELGSIIINREAAILNKRGLKNGGRYPFGFIVEGNGRISAVNEVVYLDIPKAQSKGMISFCPVGYHVEGQMKLPSWAECIKIVRGKNINPFELQWVVDKIGYAPNGRKKITIQSLNDYNSDYNFKTNTKYMYQKGDRVEFIRNGDGKIFSDDTYGVLNYAALSPIHDKVISGKDNADADYFNQLLIEDDGRLDDLKEGAVIELQRPVDCTDAPNYFEICATIPLEKHTDAETGEEWTELQYPTGLIYSFDTYIVNRVIGSFPAISFEHHSPSDFWGDRLDDTGRAHFVNKYENERRYGRNITVSAPNQINYFGDIIRTFSAPEQGDIVAVGINDGKIGLAIGEFDNFLFQVADDLVRVGADGTIRALPADSIVSDAQPKVRGQFGCGYESIGSILFGDGWVTWADVNVGSHILHDYSEAKPVDEGKVQSWTRRRYKAISQHNAAQSDPLNKLFFETGLNHHTGAEYITIKALRQSGINNEKGPFLKPNETIIFHPKENEWLGFASFTPEAYSFFDLNDSRGCSFISFLHGIPHAHTVTANRFNEFFGNTVDRVVGVVLNANPDKLKSAKAIEVQSDKDWFVAEVLTDNPNFRSEIPMVRFERNAQKINASFLCNANARGGIYGNDPRVAGENTKGYYVSVLLVRDNTYQRQYNTIDDNKRVQYDELDLIIFKYVVTEQSGMTQNL